MRYLFVDVSNLRYSNAEGTRIDCDVEWLDNPHLIGSHPFTAGLNDPTAEHSEEIFIWAEAGYFGPIASYVEPPIQIPQIVSRAQARVVLTEAGLWDEVVTAVEEFNFPAVKIWFEDAREWQRDNVYVIGLATQLGLTEEEVDALFLAAYQRI